ncbi:MAG TPA: efflux RND transporter periplasmic adaptor subunit [bacterium]|nr:efflux RND transporter periplasmic adaptor subunit [bacterium]HPR89260.1 efflux RND transporter periplasmic adaptor subunit [bacterium]
MKTEFRILFVMAAATLLLGGCGRQQKKGVGGFAMPPMPVEASKVAVQTVADQFSTIGTIESLDAITVVSEIDGLVRALPFSEGGYIRKGETIALLDDSQWAAEVARAQALYDQSKATYDRTKTIVHENAASIQDLDDASAALKVAEANLALAQARFAKTRIVAPFSGIIGARRVAVGSYLRPGDPITVLANIDEMRVTFYAPERYIEFLRHNAEVHLITTALPDLEFKGTVAVIEPLIDPGTRSARIVARVANPQRKLRPGMSANIHAVLSERQQALTIPSEAVFGSGDQSFVFVINPDSSVNRRPLKLGTQLADAVEVIDGLQPGMMVVRAGHQKLFDGGKVVPIMPMAEGTPRPGGMGERDAQNAANTGRAYASK